MQPKSDFGPGSLLVANTLQQRQCSYLCFQESKNGFTCVQFKFVYYLKYTKCLFTQHQALDASLTSRQKPVLWNCQQSGNKRYIYDGINLIISVLLPRSHYSLQSKLQLMSVQKNIVFCFHHLKIVLPPSTLSHSLFHGEVFSLFSGRVNRIDHSSIQHN